MRKRVDEVLEERQEQYGDAQPAFTAIGRIWGALLRIDDIQAHEVALMVDALKTVRLFNDPTYIDSWDDKTGYVRLAREIAGVNES